MKSSSCPPSRKPPLRSPVLALSPARRPDRVTPVGAVAFTVTAVRLVQSNLPNEARVKDGENSPVETMGIPHLVGGL